jgi:glutamate/tyrosine decarboxylase-like PLP-dependent enzyme
MPSPKDRARGAVPVMVVATAGTTGGGMIDPLRTVPTSRAPRSSGTTSMRPGAVARSPRSGCAAARGHRAADSITIDAHKWLATTMGCAMFITGHGALLSEVFHASTSFMPSSLAATDPYLNSVQWSRRFIGLRLFLALAAAGWRGLSAHVERSVRVIERVREKLTARGWEIANDSQLAVLDAVPPADHGEVRALVRRVVASGRAWVAATSFEGRDVVRICATHGETSDLGLRDGDVEFDLHREHEIQHLQGADAEVAQLTVGRKRTGNRAFLAEDVPDQPDQAVAYVLESHIFGRRDIAAGVIRIQQSSSPTIHSLRIIPAYAARIFNKAAARHKALRR